MGRLEALGSILDMLQLSNFPTTSIIIQITGKRKKSAFLHFLTPKRTVLGVQFFPNSSYLVTNKRIAFFLFWSKIDFNYCIEQPLRVYNHC